MGEDNRVGESFPEPWEPAPISSRKEADTKQKHGLSPLGSCEGPGLVERCQVEWDFTFKQKAFSSHVNDHLEERKYYAN